MSSATRLNFLERIRWPNTAVYSAVGDTEDSEEDGQPVKRAKEAYFVSSTFAVMLPWVLALTFAITTAWALLRDSSPSSVCLQSNTYVTEFEPAQQGLSVKQVRFTSGIRHGANGSLYRTNPEQKAYVGRPHPDIDLAWYDMTKGLDIFATEEEAAKVGKDLYRFPGTGLFQVEIEWLHDLHCLNYIRKSFDYEYYTADLHHPLDSHMAHRDHCINVLRQVLQCHGDLTPLPKMWDPGAEREYTEFERLHTCRDFGHLREWATERSYDAYVRRMTSGQK